MAPSSLPSDLAYPLDATTDGESTGPVTVTGWWTVAASASTALAEVKAALPHWGTVSTGSGFVQGTVDDSSYFAQTESSGTLAERTLDAEVVGVSADRSILQVEVTEAYRPAKPAGDEIPDTAVVTATLRTYNTGTKPTPSTRSSVVTHPQNIAALASQINALPTHAVFGPASCPNETLAGDQLLTLDFRGSVGGPVLAQVTVDRDGTGGGPCSAGLAVTIDGAAEPALDASTGHGVFDSLALLALVESATAY